jgi:protein-disulfide isomerase
MPRPSCPVPLRVKRSILLTLLLVLCAPLFAIDVDPKLDKAVRELLPVCSDAKITYAESPVKLPERFRGTLVQVESARPSCKGQYVAVLSPVNGVFLGSPWGFGEEEGTSIEQKLHNFTMRNLGESMDVTIDRKATEDGLFPATLSQSTEAGKVPLRGFVDQQGKTFFFGAFRKLNDDMLAQRVKAFDAFVPDSPAKGASKPTVTIMEFSDFQCPSCKRASGYVDAILKTHADQVRYVRFDLPLAGHPWAFAAALSGRAIYRQKPEAFWEYKHAVYESQENLNAFMIWDWARGWAEDHELDMKKFDADVADAKIRTELLEGAGTAFSNDVRATPTYFVNGALVDAGDEGKALAAYVDKLLTK